MPVIFPDVELWACGTIRTALGSLYTPTPYVGVAVPTTRPSIFVTVRRDGGPVEDFVIERPRLSVNCWAMTEDAATLLARRVSAIMRGAASAVTESGQAAGFVSGIRQIGGPSPIADAQPRRLLVFQLTARGADLVNPTP